MKRKYNIQTNNEVGRSHWRRQRRLLGGLLKMATTPEAAVTSSLSVEDAAGARRRLCRRDRNGRRQWQLSGRRQVAHSEPFA